MELELEFDSITHTYTLDGVKLPSVTQLCSVFDEDIDEEYELTVEAAAERGCILHEVLALLLGGTDITEIEYPSSYEGYVEAINNFLSDHEIFPLEIEMPIFDAELKVAGTPDLLCDFDDTLSIVEYKFVSQINKPRVKAQLNGYREIYIRQGVYPNKLIVVQFMPDGKYRIYPVKMDSYEFMLCLKLYMAKTKKHPRGVIE